jgi:hypothetical protein
MIAGQTGRGYGYDNSDNSVVGQFPFPQDAGHAKATGIR